MMPFIKFIRDVNSMVVCVYMCTSTRTGGVTVTRYTSWQLSMDYRSEVWVPSWRAHWRLYCGDLVSRRKHENVSYAYRQDKPICLTARKRWTRKHSILALAGKAWNWGYGSTVTIYIYVSTMVNARVYLTKCHNWWDTSAVCMFTTLPRWDPTSNHHHQSPWYHYKVPCLIDEMMSLTTTPDPERYEAQSLMDMSIEYYWCTNQWAGNN